MHATETSSSSPVPEISQFSEHVAERERALERERLLTMSVDSRHELQQKVEQGHIDSLKKESPTAADEITAIEVAASPEEKFALIDEKYRSHVDDIILEIKNGKDLFADGRFAAIVDFWRNPESPVGHERLKDPELLQYLHDLLETSPKRFQAYARELGQLEQRIQRGKTPREKLLGGKLLIFADYTLTQIAADVRQKIFQDSELKSIYEFANKDRAAEEVRVHISKELQKPGAFRELIEKKDGILHFAIFYLGPLWASVVGAANGLVFLQNTKNSGAALYAAAGIGAAYALRTSDYKMLSGDPVTNYLDRFDPTLVRVQYFLQNPSSGAREADLMRTINWKELQASDLRLNKESRHGWGYAELKHLGNKAQLVQGARDQREFHLILEQMNSPELSGKYFSPEQNEERRWVYKKFAGKFTLHEMRRIIDALQTRRN